MVFKEWLSRIRIKAFGSRLKRIQWDAEHGVAAAQCDLGQCYFKGLGVPRSYPEAVKWYRKAAAQGVPEAQFVLANCYYVGRGVGQDHAEAMKWYRRAAGHGHPQALSILSIWSKG